MAVTINASTTSGLVMTSDLSGVLTFQQGGVSLPNGGVAPAFSAYLGTTQTVTTSVFTKVQCNTIEFDTNSNYDNATNYRFTPTVAGYYQVSGQIATSAVTNSTSISAIYKNGVAFKYGNFFASATTTAARANVSALIYMNGSTDYIELYGYCAGTGMVSFLTNPNADNYFQAVLVRGA
jgi:hypothetical protein